MDYTYTPTPTPASSAPKKWRFRPWFITLIVVLVIFAGIKMIPHVGNATVTVIRQIAGDTTEQDAPDPKLPKISEDPEYQMPDNDKSRLDILILGMRGKNDMENGGLLTDTIMLLSVDTKTNVATLTAIPRDLTVRITDTKTEKINTAYIYNGLGGTKKLYSRILGVNIDNIVVFDFEAFKYVVESLGGIAITLDKPFDEKEQWGYSFSLPAGVNTLTGDQALYYVRSRYGSSDFDRSRRQMQVVMAIKTKILALNLTSDPLKALELVTTIRKHIDTDLNIFDLGVIKDLMQEGSSLDNIKRYQLTTENLLYETKINGIYELLPRGNTLLPVKKFFQTILTGKPTLPTPTPSPQ